MTWRACLTWQVRIECEDDLWRHYALSKGWANAYIMEDNATCVHPPAADATLGPPGWGGSYAGSKTRCVASHDLRRFAQPDACLLERGGRPHQPGTSFEDFDTFPRAGPREAYDWERATWRK